VDQLPWVLARFLAWTINTIVAAIAAKRRISCKRYLRFECRFFKVAWFSSETFADTE
jgi:hypothetical protein